MLMAGASLIMAAAQLIVRFILMQLLLLVFIVAIKWSDALLLIVFIGKDMCTYVLDHL